MLETIQQGQFALALQRSEFSLLCCCYSHLNLAYYVAAPFVKLHNNSFIKQ